MSGPRRAIERRALAGEARGQATLGPGETLAHPRGHRKRHGVHARGLRPRPGDRDEPGRSEQQREPYRFHVARVPGAIPPARRPRHLLTASLQDRLMDASRLSGLPACGMPHPGEQRSDLQGQHRAAKHFTPLESRSRISTFGGEGEGFKKLGFGERERRWRELLARRLTN
jgi:hypothetical protein